MKPRLLVPGLLPVDPGRETFRVRAGGSTTVVLQPDDRLTVRDVQGAQRALLDADEFGRADLFGPESPPGAEESFVAGRAGSVTVAVPAGEPVVEGGLPATDLQLELQRASPRLGVDPALPEPLAEPRLDFEVPRASARAYDVKAGEWIQVIDVKGRQCSDFLAFHTGKLQEGEERGLDSTTTRSLMGNAYPTPGLHGKFYDQDQVALVEVVRDTVGRHDTFGLACYAKYYEDIGYFGHVNCTDNFNAELLPYTIAPRKGWPALNLFFNTAFDSANLYVTDEPWSRPGDYVLFRALTDLVCLSSACPDDIDPANAWNPTEVHVRVYPAKERFSAAIAHRVTPDAEPKLTRDTGFRPRTGELTSRFSEYNGYWLPTEYDNLGAVAEYWACREQAALMDLSPLRKWEVLGPDAEELLQATVTRDIRRLGDGQVVYTALCNDTGGMIDDGTVFRITPTNFRFVGGSEYDGIWLREQAERLVLARVGQGVDRRARERRRTGPGEPRGAVEADLDGSGADAVRGAQVVPLLGRSDRRPAGAAAHRLPHGLHRRARLRALLPSRRTPRSCGTRSWRRGRRVTPSGSTRSTCCASRRASSSPATSSTIRSTRSRPASASPSRPTRRTTSSARRRSSSDARIRSARSSASSSRATSRRATATACMSAASRSAWSRAARARPS